MSKITFRADDALVEQLDALDASKSEVMREALREFLDRHPSVGGEREVATPERAEVSVDGEGAMPELNVNISLDGVREASVDTGVDDAPVQTENECKQCGETVSPDHSFCPNCGEEHRRQSYCECGEEVRSGWTFCPGCGRRSPTSDVLDRNV